MALHTEFQAEFQGYPVTVKGPHFLECFIISGIVHIGQGDFVRLSRPAAILCQRRRKLVRRSRSAGLRGLNIRPREPSGFLISAGSRRTDARRGLALAGNC